MSSTIKKFGQKVAKSLTGKSGDKKRKPPTGQSSGTPSPNPTPTSRARRSLNVEDYDGIYTAHIENISDENIDLDDVQMGFNSSPRIPSSGQSVSMPSGSERGLKLNFKLNIN